jgi:hypothetical protein
VLDAKRLRSLEDEDRKLKNLLAEPILDNATRKELLSKKMVGPGVKLSPICVGSSREVGSAVIAVCPSRVSVFVIDRRYIDNFRHQHCWPLSPAR